MHLRIAEACGGLDADGESARSGAPRRAGRRNRHRGSRLSARRAALPAPVRGNRSRRHGPPRCTTTPRQLTDPERLKLQLELTEVRYAAHRPRRPAEAAREVEALATTSARPRVASNTRGSASTSSAICVGRVATGPAAQRQMMRAEQIGRLGDERERVVALAEAARCLTLLERDLSHAEALLAEARGLVETPVDRAGGDPRRPSGCCGSIRDRSTRPRSALLMRASFAAASRTGSASSALSNTCIMLELQRHQVRPGTELV